MLEVGDDEFEDSLQGSIRAAVVNYVLQNFQVHCLEGIKSVHVNYYQGDQQTYLAQDKGKHEDSRKAAARGR